MNYQVPQNNPQMVNDVHQYRLDVYGEAVRVATQLQQTCIPNQIHVSMNVHVQCYQKFEFEQVAANNGSNVMSDGTILDMPPSYWVRSIKDLQKSKKVVPTASPSIPQQQQQQQQHVEDDIDEDDYEEHVHH